jgi:hypothetical protein
MLDYVTLGKCIIFTKCLFHPNVRLQGRIFRSQFIALIFKIGAGLHEVGKRRECGGRGVDTGDELFVPDKLINILKNNTGYACE